ncbi:MAG TPA: hypothetical protein VN493_03055 [Thermoanaerobaculia bacterium]|nr:hypothetical protein [Thermoanaerobaculia bacterium]
MKRNVILGIVVLALAAVAPVWAAAPFGQFGGIVGGGNSGAGLLPIHGWALDDDGVEAVDLYVDGKPAGRANYGRGRPGVTQKHPNFPDSAAPGFAFQIDTTRYLNGLHTVEARVRSKTGEVRSLNTRVIEFLNHTHNLKPFGRIEFPAHQAELRGNCSLTDPARRFSVITGYAMDLGLNEDDTGVGYVELLIDRALFSNSKSDCRFSAVEGGLADCYGLRRVDLEPLFPHVKDAPHSGFRFVLDVGVLMSFFGYAPGSHLLTIRAGDHADQTNNIAELVVTFMCDEDIANEAAFGDIYLPKNGLVYSGTVQVQGWALDWEGVHQVFLIVDGDIVGEATYGLSRPGVSALFPGYPDSPAPGWTVNLDTRKLSEGRHDLEVLVRDDVGNETFIGKRPFSVFNP